METLIKHTDSVLLVGEGDLMASVAVCLLKSGHRIEVVTHDSELFAKLLDTHLRSQEKHTRQIYPGGNINFVTEGSFDQNLKIAIVITPENLVLKSAEIQKLESILPATTIIAVNTESIPLSVLQADCKNAGRLIGLNWSEPAHTTFFLEIIRGDNETLAEEIRLLAKSYWGKDPYIVSDLGIRSRLVSAMAREASFLVDNGYASVDDIDRACRNDAGYYLPFSGNCRYMDLMGTYAYGMVMKDLNPDLSKEIELPEFFEKILAGGGIGMENGKGFYNYSTAEIENWKKTMEEFSYQIHNIIEKYPFNYSKEPFTD